jgi:hypothetical protein
MTQEHNRPEERFVEVTVVTTSGTWPSSGAEQVPIHQKVRVQLEKAARYLEITNTDGWIATVGGREIDIEKSYLDNQLSGTVVIDFGPRQGGGGNA